MVSDNLSGHTRRRALLTGAGSIAAAGALAAAGPAAAAAAAAPARTPARTTARPAADPARARLAAAGHGGLRRGSLPLGLTGPGGPRTATAAGDRFSTVAVTWSTGSPALSIRTRTPDGVWRGWEPLSHLHDGPTRDTDEWRAARRTQASVPHWVGDSDAVEVAADGPVRDLRVELLDATPQELAPATSGVQARSAPVSKIYTRAEWGADESLRDGTLRYLPALQQVHVHHTAGANGYAAADVPRILRSIYAYHTLTLGWSDVGYNLFVDKFGRAFEGRAGGARRLVRGAHTLGFNHNSCGIALLGNHEGARPSSTAVAQVVALAAYKFDLYGLRADRKINVVSEGSDKYPKSAKAYLWAMDSHRDTNDTACPGRYVHEAMTNIRTMTQARIDAY
ncbi:N-acetylmuramoyl-L-alanine amidase [Nocardioides alkalitolerans]|uniref:N-acetylmuramoyl-L-alanine amidase n=1 Tax=Nocardioides alkalitolerans TaxID=281714 RepID=UPI0004000037|nr:N-acetylmuramoyl-L-alanine amidase [Nocardioides alkalitolerans]